MGVLIRTGSGLYRFSGFDSISERLEYNPVDMGKGLLGFHLRGERVLPVFDLNRVLGMERGRKWIYFVTRDAVFLVSYDGIWRDGEGEEIDLGRVAEDLRGELDGRNGGNS